MKANMYKYPEFEMPPRRKPAVPPNPQCPLCAPIWPPPPNPNRFRVKLTTAAGLTAAAAAAGLLTGYAAGWRAL
jgi:hypothetical protein